METAGFSTTVTFRFVHWHLTEQYMKIKFDQNQQYQKDAVNAVVSIFKSQPHIDNIDDNRNSVWIKNNCTLPNEQVLKNVQRTQARNGIPESKELDGHNYTVEMETGTGKTYVYIKSIYELNKTYGFKKFVIVVPSVAIREGVMKNLEITKSHFSALYDAPLIDYFEYKRKRITELRDFASANHIKIMVINIDAFAKAENVINKHNEALGPEKPITHIQCVRPIVIVDEPQNMETGKRKEALLNLNPLCMLRFSATHKKTYNLIYRLDPVKAYNMGLVKQIEVDSIVTENRHNDAFVQLESVKSTKTTVLAKITIDCNTDDGVTKKTFTVKPGDDLYKLSNEREIYKKGHFIEVIDSLSQTIKLSNGTIINVGASQGGLTDEVMKLQIRKTIEEHLNKEKTLNPKGIKVLSLFFIDKVSNYREYNKDGDATKGKFATWFEETYTELSKTEEYKTLAVNMEGAHNGYFSQDKKGKVKDTNGATIADDGTYSLIMKDKEKLLSTDCPLRFIFSHTALREGWDSPNVFQLCTMNETKSDMKKRQEIGRGLRLAIGPDGQRIYDKKINKLTIIANESYDDFAKALQKEMKDDFGISFERNIKNKHNKTTNGYQIGIELDPKLEDIWTRIKNQRSEYRLSYNTEDVVKKAAYTLKSMPKINKPTLQYTKKKVSMNNEEGFKAILLTEEVVDGYYARQIPRHAELYRKTHKAH